MMKPLIEGFTEPIVFLINVFLGGTYQGQGPPQGSQGQTTYTPPGPAPIETAQELATQHQGASTLEEQQAAAAALLGLYNETRGGNAWKFLGWK